MKKSILIIISFFLLFSICQAMWFRKEISAEIKYENWKHSLEKAGRDSITVRYRIQSEARKILQKNPESDTRYYAILGLQLALADSSEINPAKEEIIRDFPASKACYEFANQEFYDLIYPVWSDDHEKIIIIEKLLLKYHSSPWRRTMYQYICYSLANVGDSEMLKQYLSDWRNAFPWDYLPWFVSAANYQLMKEDAATTLEFAQKAYDLSLNPQKPQFYPKEEWLLEKRSAKILTAYNLGNVLIDSSKYSQADTILVDAINNNQLSIDDETTDCRLHYALAKSYAKQGKSELAAAHCCQALIAGDSRNTYSPKADSLLQELTGSPNSLDTCRKEVSYNDVTFTDVTDKMGLKGVSGNRIAWGDFDNDGWEDFLLSGSRLFQNQKGKKFINVTKDVFMGDISFGGALWGDVDNDGDLDIITKDPENIWINKDFRFYRFQNKSDFIDNKISTEGMAVADLNKDGFLDIYLANYEGDGVFYHDQMFFGNSDGSFRDVTYIAGAVAYKDKALAGRGVNIGDYNNDHLPDIYVSNYRLNRNLMFVNQGQGIFKEKAEYMGIAGEEIDGWWGHTIGSEWGDIDNDGYLDLITCNLAHPRYLDFSNKTRLYLNSGFPDFTFKDIRTESGIRYEETNSEPAWGDLDNDGYLDLYITDVYEGRRSFLYMSNGDYTFRDVTWLSGTRHFNGWGVADCDYDKDGDLDLLVAGGNIQLFRNDTKNENNWLQIQIAPAKGNNAIGTRIVVHGRDLILTREIQGGKGTTNQHSLIQHFGLGNRKSGLTLTVQFPSGKTMETVIKDINCRYTIKEGK
ncbi:MAG: CRTAC1 family protein [Candidatus Cloacimonetes bacterium]|nr:CRTAC1 family protein [Candidatus Cloacimonadota bacterium]